MKLIICSILGVLFFSSLVAQWNQQTSNTTFNLNDVYFTSNEVGFAVGDNGRIIKTTDGGTNWVEENAIPTCDLNSVYFISPNSGWIASSCGIHSTNDGGQTWTLQSSANGIEMNDIFFVDSDNGWSVGNELIIMRTTDGGDSWLTSTLESVVFTNPLLAVYFRDANNGWIGGGERLHYTTHGGQTWLLGSSFLIDWIYSIDFVDDFVGVAAGMGGSVTNTINWGDTWQFNGSITPDFEYLYGVNFATESMVYMVGADGLIYVSSNGGSSWSLQESEVGEDLNAVHFPSENIGYAVGNNGTIIKFGQSVSISNPSASQFIFNVFPNPVIDKVSITFSSASQGNISSLRLLNSLGQELPMEILFTSGGAELDLSSIEPGAYFIEMETQDQGTLVSRLLKE